MGKKQVVLVTVSGQDGPGITSELTGILAKSRANILDIGQAVIRNLLSLSILFELDQSDADRATIKELLFRATEMGLKLEFQVVDASAEVDGEREKKTFQYALTLLGDSISAQSLHEVTHILAKFGLNIDLVQRLSETEFSCVELLTSSKSAVDEKHLKNELLGVAGKNQVDIAVQEEGLFRRAKRLVVLDMDSTLIENEVIDEFARELGVYDEVADLTSRAMKGQMDYDESLKLRCEKLKGLTKKNVDSVFKRIELTQGADELTRVLKKLGYKVALISGGFSCIADRLKEQLGIDYAYANQLEFKNDTFTGNVIPPVVNPQRKADLLDVIAQQEQIHLDQVIAIGDGANDLLMLEKAGLGIAFNAKPTVSEQADLSLNQRNLRSIFYLLGISSRDLQKVLS